MLKTVLKWINKDFNTYKDLSRQDLLKECINKKLAFTLKKYNEEIDWHSDYLISRSSVKVLKALTKIQKKNDVNVLKENMKEELLHEVNKNE